MEFVDLGKRGYRETWEFQHKLHSEVVDKKLKSEEVPQYILFVEHPPVYTIGMHGNETNLLANTAHLKENDIEIIKVDRGGDITFHGPGQLVVYPVLDLEKYKTGLKDYIWKLEEIVINTIEYYGIKGERIKGATGVWIDAASPRMRKICAIGVRCSRFVTMHGFALNVNTDLNYFNYINPCGYTDRGVTSIEKEIGIRVDSDEVKSLIKDHFLKLFNCKK